MPTICGSLTLAKLSSSTRERTSNRSDVLRVSGALIWAGGPTGWIWPIRPTSAFSTRHAFSVATAVSSNNLKYEWPQGFAS